MDSSLVSSYFENISLIIPAYNEEKAIEHTLDELSREECLQSAEIIVIDDGSKDNTANIVAKFSKIRLIRHHTNMGYGSSITTGVRAANREWVIWFDSDGQHRPEDLIALGSRLVSDGLDYCVGIRDSSSHEDQNRKFGKSILRLIIHLLVGKPLKDFNSGLRGFRHDINRRLLPLLPARFGASTATSLLMLQGKYRGAEVPIVVRQRKGHSSVNQIRDGILTLVIILRMIMIYKPLRLFVGLGSFLVLTGVVYGFIRAFSDGQGIPVLASLIVIFGLQTLFFGLLSDQINSLRYERFENTD